VAFREETWHMLGAAPGASPRWEALGWLLGQASAHVQGLPVFSLPQGSMSASELAEAEAGSDRFARRAADFPWTTSAAEHLLQGLASSGAGIRQLDGTDRQVHRAEVLVQGMDRLVVELNHQGVSIPGSGQKLDALFADVRLPDNFDAVKFCQDLDQFSNSIGKL
jgi:hypothetical protein